MACFSKIINKKKMLLCFLAFLVLVSGIAIVFHFPTGIIFFDTYDYIEGIFWAEATLRAGALTSPEYVYYYIVPFGSNIIMAPLVYLLGPGLLANQLGMLVYLAVFLAVLIRFARLVYSDHEDRLAFCALFCMFFYTYIGDNLLHHLLSYGIGLVCLLGELSCIMELRRGRNRKRNLVLLVLFCLWSAANGVAAMALSTVPVLAAWIYSDYRCGRLFNRENMRSYLPAVAATAAGFLIYKMVDAQTISLYMYDDRFILADASGLIGHLLSDLPANYLRLFYYDPVEDISAFSPSGILRLCRLMFALCILILPFRMRRRIFKDNSLPDISEADRHLVLMANMMNVLIAVSQCVLFTTSAERYLFIGTISMFFFTAVGLLDVMKKEKGNMILIPAICLALLFSAKLAGDIRVGEQREASLEKACHALDEEGLPYGYIIGRYYKVLELVSHGENRNTSIIFDEDKGKFYIEYDRIYLEELEKPEDLARFYVLREGEYDAEDPENMLLETVCRDKMTVDQFTIYIFDIADWDKLFVKL